MIPRADILAWREEAPWQFDRSVEQDLLLSRAVVEIFSDPMLAEHLAFRGGTALHKLFLSPAARYSEDIDLVQIRPSPIGPVLDHLRGALGSWLGEPRRKFARRNAALLFDVPAEPPTQGVLRLKLVNPEFIMDTDGLLRPGIDYSIGDAFAIVADRLSLAPQP